MARVSMNPTAPPTLGLAAHPSKVVSSPACPHSTVALPAAIALNGLASLDPDASSPIPLAVPRVSMNDPRPPSVMDVVGKGGFDSSSPPAMAMLPTDTNPTRSWAAPPLTSAEMAAVTSSPTQPLVSPLSGTPVAGIAPATLPEFSLSPPWIWATPPQQPAATAAPPLQPSASWAPAPPLPSLGSALMTSTSGILIGNVTRYPKDTIIHLKTLSFVPPSLQNGEVVVRPSIDLIWNGSTHWKTTAVGYFLGKRPYFHHLNAYVHSIWPVVREVTATVTGFYFFQFKTEAAMEEVIEGGPWLFQGQPIVLQKWEPSMALRKLKYTQVPVWIKLRHLPVGLWTTDGLSTVASGIGKPLRVGMQGGCGVRMASPKCTSCHSLGHATSACVLHKPPKSAVAVYVKKPKHVATSTSNSTVDPTPEPLEDEAIMESDVVIKNKGKQIVLFNTFDLLQSTNDDAECSSRGPNESSPLGVDPC
ncbi:UNVERIFIED_CONTAM: hypothetical protein Sradi_6551700 [Sesamum radiatum]|uniref:DUF4283 domain-containing protein n=1 Tax=Sesamum radiatum TaxID=300843 RepID=A0AAW2JWG8_SESRA